MLSKSHSVAGPNGSGNFAGKKKKAPPRPPPPTGATNSVRPSQSFHTGNELQSQKISSFGQRSSNSMDAWGSSRATGGSDLIDFSTPEVSDQVAKVEGPGLKSKEPADYMYRVGASIFYIRSQLKNPAPSSQAANPFSPPRPSAQAMLSSPAKHAGQTSTTRYSNVPAQQSQSASGAGTKYKPTIIKRPNENNNTIKPAFVGGSNFNNNKFGGEGSLRSSSGSSDWSDYSQPSSQQPSQQQQQYGNIPVAWDEPPVQHREPPPPKVFPTIIKPPLATKPSFLPKPTGAAAAGTATSVNRSSVTSTITTNPAWQNLASSELQNNDTKFQRNYYDDPPDSDFDEEDDPDDSIVSPPMPSEPPPPPPPDVALNQWMENTTHNSQQAYIESSYSNQRTETDRAYALVLYDYLSDVEGDLPLQVGDLVYLIKKIDEEWLYGHCAGVEGMFPCNYVNVVLPLPEELPQEVQQIEQTGIHGSEIANPQTSNQIFFADALYTFDAEADGDLSLRIGDMVKIFGRLNEDWLYGEVAGKVGQFPTTFVDPVPADLPIIPT